MAKIQLLAVPFTELGGGDLHNHLGRKEQMEGGGWQWAKHSRKGHHPLAHVCISIWLLFPLQRLIRMAGLPSSEQDSKCESQDIKRKESSSILTAGGKSASRATSVTSTE